MEPDRESTRSSPDAPSAIGAGRDAEPVSGRSDGTPPPPRRGGRIDPDGDADIVQEASEESFPASDPPSYWPRPSSGPARD